MKKLLWSLCLITTVAPVWAQDPTGKRPNANQSGLNQNSANTTSNQMLMPTSKLIGTKLTDVDGEECGSVNAFVFDAAGSVHYVIVGKGGLLGIGEDEIAVPWSAFSCKCEVLDGKMTCYPKISVPGKKLLNAAKLQAKHYAEIGDKEWTTKNATLFNVTLPTKSLRAEEMHVSSDFINTTLKATGDVSAGVVDELMIKNGAGRISFVVVGLGGVAGVGKTYVALPFADVKFTKAEGENCAVVAKSKEQLEAATKVTPNEYPELGLSSVRDRVNTDR